MKNAIAELPFYTQVYPSSTGRITPVRCEASSEERETAAEATVSSRVTSQGAARALQC